MTRPPDMTPRVLVLIGGNLSDLARGRNFTSLSGRERISGATGTGCVREDARRDGPPRG